MTAPLSPDPARPAPPPWPPAEESGTEKVAGPTAGIGGTGTGTAASGTANGNGASGDWTDQVTDLVVDTVDKVRNRTTGPILDVAHAAVYALVALVLAIPVVIVLLAGLVRLLNWAIPGDVWIVYALMAVLFWLVGWVLWSRRVRP